MTNPISPTGTGLPPINYPLSSEDGSLSPWWYQVLLSLYQRTGGATGASSSDATAIAQAALTAANNAASVAALAESKATTALAEVGTAQATANNATILGTNAGLVAANALATATVVQSLVAILQTSKLGVANNLVDLASIPNARTNLGVATWPVTFTFAGAPSGSTYVPIVRQLSLPAQFSGAFSYAGTTPTANASFAISFIRGGVTTLIGTFTLVHGTHTGYAPSFSPRTSLVPGDVLQIDAPVVPDGTLADVAITLALLLA